MQCMWGEQQGCDDEATRRVYEAQLGETGRPGTPTTVVLCGRHATQTVIDRMGGSGQVSIVSLEHDSLYAPQYA